MAELIMNQPIFPGESSVDQLVEIIKVMGTPSRQQILAMNPNYTEFKFPNIKSQPLSKVNFSLFFFFFHFLKEKRKRKKKEIMRVKVK